MLMLVLVMSRLRMPMLKSMLAGEGTACFDRYQQMGVLG